MYEYVASRTIGSTDPLGLVRIEVGFNNIAGGDGGGSGHHRAYIIVHRDDGTLFFTRGGPANGGSISDATTPDKPGPTGDDNFDFGVSLSHPVTTSRALWIGHDEMAKTVVVLDINTRID